MNRTLDVEGMEGASSSSALIQAGSPKKKGGGEIGRLNNRATTDMVKKAFFRKAVFPDMSAWE